MKRKRTTEIVAVEIFLSEGTSYRVSMKEDKVWEIESRPWSAMPAVRGPITIGQFLDLLTEEKRKLAEDIKPLSARDEIT